MLSSAELKRFEALLLGLEARLTKDLLDLAEEDPGNPGLYIAKHTETGGDTDDDNAVESTALSDDMPVVDDLQEELRDIRKALDAIKKGSYGICKYCKKDIDIKRLEARPESSSCVACKKNPYSRAVAISLFVGTTVLVLALDLLTKRWLFDGLLLDATPKFSFWGGRVQHFLHANLGATFNTPLPMPIILLGATLFCGWLLLFLFSNTLHWKHPFLVVSAGLVFGGALGNMYDRLFLGFVRDWILLWQRAVANIADFAVLVGCVLLLVFAIFIPARQRHRSVERGRA